MNLILLNVLLLLLGLFIGIPIGISIHESDLKKEIKLRKEWEKLAKELLTKRDNEPPSLPEDFGGTGESK